MRPVSDRDRLMKITFRDLLLIQILSSLSTFVGPLIDGIIISDFLGSDYMAAFGLVTPITVLIAATANIFNAGSQNVAGKYLGQGRSDKLNGLLTSTVLWGAAVGLVITLLLLFGGKPVLTVLGAEGKTLNICTDYVNMYAIGIVPTVLMPSLVGFLQMDNGGKTAVAASVVLTGCDVVFDFLAVLVFKNGMIGIGLATSFSYVLALLVLLTHFLKKNVRLHFTGKGSPGKDIKKVLLCGLPAATFLLCNALRVSVTNNIILGVSNLASVAAFSIQNTIRPLTIAFTVGTGITSLLVCSVISGEENRHALRKELSYILKLGMLIALLLTAAILLLARYPLALLFCIGQPEAFIELVTSVIRQFGVSIPFAMLNVIFIYYYQSMRRLWLSTVISVLQNVVFYLAAAKLLSTVMGVDGIWLGYIVSEVLTLLTIVVITWGKNARFPKSVHDFLLLPESFGVSAENRMNVTAVTLEDAVGISERIAAFCRDRGIDSRRSMAAALCTEELAVLAVQNGRAEKTYVDIYLTYKNGELSIRMRDNSRPFDRRLLAGIPEADDPGAHVGVRLVKGLAREITYHVVLGMNTYSMVI